MFQLNVPVVIRAKLFFELKLVTDNLLSIYAAANCEATDSITDVCSNWK